ncbi:hypothetical protein DPMN_116075 [Dreissena polymorpha]|uniref:Uncharacterized protein n=1 Tax=Dreissena polymorpha TaxID=45954 RepID=A0A9D4QTL3_DREPO|nr:hypothetical protein DPMN_116075 [Dreissena polymorpha]
MMSLKLDLAQELVGTVRLQMRSAGRSQSENSENILRLDNISRLSAIREGNDHVCIVCNERHNRYKRKHLEATYSRNQKSCLNKRFKQVILEDQTNRSQKRQMAIP